MAYYRVFMPGWRKLRSVPKKKSGQCVHILGSMWVLEKKMGPKV